MDFYMITGFICVISFIFAVKGINIYRIYHNSIYEFVFSNFLEFYFKYKFKKNLSVSYWFNQQIGHHKIIYNNHISKNKKSNQLFITIIHKKGINCFLIVENNKINITKINTIINDQINYLSSKYQIDSKISILTTDKNNINISKCKYQIDSYCDLISILNQNDDMLNDDDINFKFSLSKTIKDGNV